MRYRHISVLFSLLLTGIAVVTAGVAVDVSQAIATSDEVTKVEHNPLFEINRSIIVEDNSLFRLGLFTDSLNRQGLLKRFEICGFSSPDGPEAFNARLASDRANAIRLFFQSKYNLPSSIFEMSSVAEDWDMTRSLVSASSIASRDDVLSIIDNTPDGSIREKRLRAFDGGRSWCVLARDIFPRVRRAEMTVRYIGGELHATLSDEVTNIEKAGPEPEIFPEPMPVAEPESVQVVVSEPADTIAVEALPEWQRHAYVKTNLPAWFLLWINAAGEYDIAPHWSVNLSLYYSGFDYFRHTRKYRTFAIMPELRWWPNRNNQGFFLAPHFGMAWYNVAFEGKYRYQDSDGKTPALGGGVNAGFRFNVSRNKRWRMELSVGFGIYHLDYDMFLNVRDGLLAGRRQRTFYGIDNAALSICYMFDVKKKGGRK